MMTNICFHLRTCLWTKCWVETSLVFEMLWVRQLLPYDSWWLDQQSHSVQFPVWPVSSPASNPDVSAYEAEKLLACWLMQPFSLSCTTSMLLPSAVVRAPEPLEEQQHCHCSSEHCSWRCYNCSVPFLCLCRQETTEGIWFSGCTFACELTHVGVCDYIPKAREFQTNSAFHPSGVGKWGPAWAGKAKAGMVQSVSSNAGCAGKTVRSLENMCHSRST